MTDEPRRAIGDWTDNPPEVRVVDIPPIEQQDPRDYEDEFVRSVVIRDRRKAGLPDYPPDKKE